MAIGFNKFMNNAGKGIMSFAGQAASGITKGARFLGKEVLPIVDKVAGGVATVASYAAPVLALTPLAEFAPAVGAVGLAARGIQKGAQAGQRAINTATQVVDTVNSVSKGIKVISGKAKSMIEKAPSVAGNMAPQVMEGMKINRPPGMGLKRLAMGGAGM
jgi:hypothetical protein